MYPSNTTSVQSNPSDTRCDASEIESPFIRSMRDLQDKIADGRASGLNPLFPMLNAPRTTVISPIPESPDFEMMVNDHDPFDSDWDGRFVPMMVANPEPITDDDYVWFNEEVDARDLNEILDDVQNNDPEAVMKKLRRLVDSRQRARDFSAE